MIEPLEPRQLLAVFAQDLSYDPTGPFSVPSGVFIEPVSKGRMLVAGFDNSDVDPSNDELPDQDLQVRRLLPDGSVDPTFGHKGVVDIEPVGSIIFTGARILAVQERYNGYVLLAYTVNGKPDETFGDGLGVLYPPSENPADYFEGGVEITHVYDDGSLLLLHELYLPIGRQYQFLKLKPDGTLDPSFGNSGRVIFNSVTGNVHPSFLTDNGIYAFLESGFSTKPPRSELVRYTVDGKSRDPTFGKKGSVILPVFCTAFTEQSDGKLLFVEQQIDQDGQHPVLHRLNKNGSTDTTFGSGGTIALHNAYPTDVLGRSDNVVVLDSHKRITVAADGTIFRFSESGTLDKYPFNGTAPFGATSMQYDDKGGILVGATFGKRYALVPNAQLGTDGIVKLRGTNHGDVMTVETIAGGKARFTSNGEITDLPLADIKRIDADLIAGPDRLTVSIDVPVSANAGRGDDTIATAGGNDTLAGQSGRDKLYGGAGDDRLSGGASGDWLYSQTGNDRLYGDGGNDRLYADYPKGRATLFGGAGDDIFVTSDSGIDLVYGEGGNDAATSDPNDVLTSVEANL